MSDWLDCADCGGTVERPFWDDVCFACQGPLCGECGSRNCICGAEDYTPTAKRSAPEVDVSEGGSLGTPGKDTAAS